MESYIIVHYYVIDCFVLYGLPLVTMGADSAIVVTGKRARIILNIEVDRNKLKTTLM
jgi:hypothetical protein